jgi:hypothetical protein
MAALVAVAGGFGNRNGTGAQATPPIVTAVSPSPAPTPRPAVDPAIAAFGALDRVDSAIGGLDGEDIRNKDINDLRKRARDVRDALAARNYGDAREETQKLAEAVDQAADEEGGERIDELRNAVAALADAIPPG